MTSRTLMWLTAACVVLLFVGLALIFSTGRFITHTIDYVVGNLVNLSGINPLLARGIVILATIPFFWAVAKYTRTVFEFKKIKVSGFKTLKPSLNLYLNPYGLVIVTYVAAFFLGMYLASRSAYFGLTTGETLKWCADTLEGIRVFDSPGVDPVYGITLKPCRPDQIASLRAREVGLSGPKRVHVDDPRMFSFFDGISGRPKIWYYRTAEGRFELFDGPGKHPTTGHDLTQINAASVSELVRLYDEEVRGKRRQAIEQADIERQRIAKTEADAILAARDATINRYVNRSASVTSSSAVLVVDRQGGADEYLTQEIASRINASSSLFKPAFVRDGLFARALQGDASDLARLGLEGADSLIVLGRVSSSTTSESVAEQSLVNARITIMLRIYERTKGFPSRTVAVAGTGTGFSTSVAEKKAIEVALREAFAKLEDRR